MADSASLTCSQCGATSWHPTGHLKEVAHLYYLWCSPCTAREQDEFLAMVAAASTAEEPKARAEGRPSPPRH
jgi:hypothetical protein